MQNKIIICKIYLTYAKYNCILGLSRNERKKEVSILKNLKMKLARMEQDISQTDLAKRIGVTRQTIGMIEVGDYNPTLKLCIAICKELGKTLDDLFWEED